MYWVLEPNKWGAMLVFTSLVTKTFTIYLLEKTMKTANAKVNNGGNINNELADQKATLIKTLSTLFAAQGAHLEAVSALLEVRRDGKFVSNYHADCMLINSDGKTYYFTFGYDRAKEAEHPFFIRIFDTWFQNNAFVARSHSLYAPLSEVMNLQGEFAARGITVNVKEVETAVAA